MSTNNSVKQILQILAKSYPNPQTALKHSSPFQLLIATILSAQCTDKRVNIITRDLFAKYPTVEDFNCLSIIELEELIKTAGLWRTKAKNIKQACKLIIDDFNGIVPKTRTELMQLPGVGRKTANVILANAFGIPAFAVDTHVHRVANRLGLASSKNVENTERQLMAAIPQKLWIDAHHWLIFHGRNICKAKQPLCDKCPLSKVCQYKNQ